MAFYPKLKGKLCYLSPIDPANYPEATKWVNDLDCSIGMIFISSIIGEAKEKEVMERLSQGMNFAIVDTITNRTIGNCGIPTLDERNRHCQVGIFIGDPEYRGQGYGTEAMKLLLEFAFAILNMHSVSLRVYDFNKPAIRCYLKVGFKHCGRLRQARRIGGEWHDELIMDILEDEYSFGQVREAVRARQGQKADV